VRFIGVSAGFHSPYQRTAGEARRPLGHSPWRAHVSPGERASEPEDVESQPYSALQQAAAAGEAPRAPNAPTPGEDYGGDLVGQVHRFEQFCLAATRRLNFDVIHAHDWMTYPAGLAIARVTGKPLVVHVHSTEFDRSGVHVNQRVYDVERRGMHGSMRVIAVSQLTKNVIMRRYGVPDPKVEVVYNGVDLEPPQGEHMTGIQSKDKIVLYFGRITYQKGPEYFIYAAKRVLDVMPDVKFVGGGQRRPGQENDRTCRESGHRAQSVVHRIPARVATSNASLPWPICM
jgi:glycosyltransferase involved in cell wall biosynthesis